MQDSTECGIEMTISQVKNKAHVYLDNLPGADKFTVPDLLQACKVGVQEGATPERVRKCWEHQEKACRVMCGEQNEWLVLELHGKRRKVMCTNGGWTSRPVNG